MRYDLIVKYVAAPLLLLLGLFLIYTSGYNRGVRAVEDERESDRQKQEVVVAALKGQIQERERQHGKQVSEIRSELASAESRYAADLHRLAGVYDGRVRNSEQRAASYRASAEAGTAECRSLASYAAQLDFSLEEGRDVVEQLRSTLVFRDSQLKLLGDQLIADRQLYEDYGNYSH